MLQKRRTGRGAAETGGNEPLTDKGRSEEDDKDGEDSGGLAPPFPSHNHSRATDPKSGQGGRRSSAWPCVGAPIGVDVIACVLVITYEWAPHVSTKLGSLFRLSLEGNDILCFQILRAPILKTL
jgi:hypothetical protein